jgi:hypothetical protein
LRFPQIPFNPKSEVFAGATKRKVDNLKGKMYHQIKTQYFRKGMIYKSFNIKQIDGSSVRPTVEERE